MSKQTKPRKSQCRTLYGANQQIDKLRAQLLTAQEARNKHFAVAQQAEDDVRTLDAKCNEYQATIKQLTAKHRKVVDHNSTLVAENNLAAQYAQELIRERDTHAANAKQLEQWWNEQKELVRKLDREVINLKLDNEAGEHLISQKDRRITDLTLEITRLRNALVNQALRFED